MLLHPRPAKFLAAVEARHLGVRSRGADPYIGRRLVSLIHDAGLREVRVRALYVHSGHGGTDAFARILAPWVDAIDSARMSADDVAAAREELASWAAGPSAFGMMGLVVASGLKE
jgi:hypothetical protein